MSVERKCVVRSLHRRVCTAHYGRVALLSGEYYQESVLSSLFAARVINYFVTFPFLFKVCTNLLILLNVICSNELFDRCF